MAETNHIIPWCSWLHPAHSPAELNQGELTKGLANMVIRQNHESPEKNRNYPLSIHLNPSKSHELKVGDPTYKLASKPL